MNKSAVITLIKAVILSFLRAFLGVFIAGMAGVLAVPDWNTGKAALIALSAAALIAGLRAIQAVLTNLEPTDHAVQ